MLLNNNNTKDEFSTANLSNVKPLDEAGLMEALLESEEYWGEYTMALAKAEHEAIVSENAELLNEAVSDWIQKVKEFFKKIWAAFKSFMKWVWGEISSVFMKKASWVKKYKKDIDAGAKAATGAGKKAKWALDASKLKGFDTIPQDKEAQEKQYEDMKTAAQEAFEGEKEVQYSATVGHAMELVISLDTSKIKKEFAKAQKEIKDAESKAIKAANEANGKETDSAKIQANTKDITDAKRTAQYSLKVLQFQYSVTKKMVNYCFAFCKKCYTYKTFGRREFKEESGMSSILDNYK